MKSRTLFITLLAVSLFLSGLAYDNSCAADDRTKLIEKMIKQLTKDKKAEKREEEQFPYNPPCVSAAPQRSTLIG